MNLQLIKCSYPTEKYRHVVQHDVIWQLRVFANIGQPVNKTCPKCLKICHIKIQNTHLLANSVKKDNKIPNHAGKMATGRVWKKSNLFYKIIQQ